MSTPDIHTLREYVSRGLLSVQECDGLAIFNYTSRCTFGRAWDPVTMQARGLIIDTATGDVVACPWPKFFNHTEPDVIIPEGEPDEVTVKHDGSLGIGYLDGGGRQRWATRGRFDSPQAQIAQAIWDQRHSAARFPVGVTPLVEIIHPGTRVIVQYGWEGLILLGARTHDGGDLCRRDVEEIALSTGLRITERVGGTEAAIRHHVAHMDHTAEGFVARWGQGSDSYRVKFKSAAYLDLARIMAGVSERFVGDCWYAGRTLPAHVPEETRQWFNEQSGSLSGALASLVLEVDDIHASIMAVASDRKSYAIAAKRHGPLMGLLMRRSAGHEVDWRLHVYRSVFSGQPRPVSMGSTAPSPAS